MKKELDKKTLDYIYTIMIKESSKPYMEMDADLVSKCVEIIIESKGLKKLTQEEINMAVESLFKHMHN